MCAHPDDEVLGAGGSIARHAKSGDTVEVAILATGVFSRQKEPEVLREELRALRRDALEADTSLGVSAVHFGDLEDNAMDGLRLLDIARIVESHLARFRPEVVYTHHSGDLNVDHRLTFQAVLTAARPFASSVREIVSFEVASSTEWNVPYTFSPRIFVDITETVGLKERALAMFTNEIREYPHPRSVEAVRAAAQRWGSVAGMRYAEAFELIRALRR